MNLLPQELQIVEMTGIGMTDPQSASDSICRVHVGVLSMLRSSLRGR
jgi:hypothetical protein